MLLAGLAGTVDAVGYRELRHLFVSFMSGNSTQFGLALGGGDLPEAGRIGGLIVLFVLGSAGGTLLAAAAGRWHVPVVLAAVAALLGIGGAWPSRTVGFAAAVLAMGGLNAALERVGSVPLSLTYVTGTLVKLGRGLAQAMLGQTSDMGWLKQAVPWLGLVAGAMAGGIAEARFGRATLLIVAACALLLAAVTALASRRRGGEMR